MTVEQEEILDFLEMMVMRLIHSGYDRMAQAMGSIVDAVHRGETVWAVILATKSVADGDLGPGFVEKFRVAFNVGRIE